MNDNNSFDKLLVGLRSGQEEAAEKVVNEYTAALIAVAQRQMGAKLSRRVDPEDVVQSAYRSLFVRLQDGEYELGNGKDLWRLLTTMTLNKVRNQARHHRASRRDLDAERSMSPNSGMAFEQPSAAPSPEEAAILVDEVTAFLGSMSTTEREIVELRLQGLSTAEISDRLDRAERSVRRVLQHALQRLSSRIDQTES